MRLIEALRYSQSECITFVGAGGKTTALFQTAREIITAPTPEQRIQTVLVTTSTHLGAWQSELADCSYIVTSILDLQKLRQELPSGVVLVTGEESNQFLSGLSAVFLDELRQIGEEHNLPLLIEGDGAHTRPLKAPAEHEPVIPDFTQHVVVVAGLRGLGKPLTEDWVHRVEKYAKLSGLQPGKEITSEALVKVLISKRGGLKNIPCGARRSVLLNQADTPELQSRAKVISERLITVFDASIISSLSQKRRELSGIVGDHVGEEKGVLAAIEPIAGIILAAGGSSRFGEPKQLLTWKGQPLIRHVVLAALEARLEPVVVVVGSSSKEVQSAIHELPVRIVNNSEWEDGLSSSIRIGIIALPPRLGGCVFLQGDQPHIPPTLIRNLVEAHQTKMQPITAPMINGQRGNPVLFDTSTFPKLLSLEGDTGGRALFSHHRVHWVTWHDPKLLIDIDTPEDYEKFLQIYSHDEGRS